MSSHDLQTVVQIISSHKNKYIGLPFPSVLYKDFLTPPAFFLCIDPTSKILQDLSQKFLKATKLPKVQLQTRSHHIEVSVRGRLVAVVLKTTTLLPRCKNSDEYAGLLEIILAAILNTHTTEIYTYLLTKIRNQKHPLWFHHDWFFNYPIPADIKNDPLCAITGTTLCSMLVNTNPHTLDVMLYTDLQTFCHTHGRQIILSQKYNLQCFLPSVPLWRRDATHADGTKMRLYFEFDRPQPVRRMQSYHMVGDITITTFTTTLFILIWDIIVNHTNEHFAVAAMNRVRLLCRADQGIFHHPLGQTGEIRLLLHNGPLDSPTVIDRD